MQNAWQVPGRMFRFLGRVGELTVQWRAKDEDNAHHLRFGNGGRAELRCVFRDWPVLAPVELFVPPDASNVLIEQEVDGFVRVTFSTGETIRVPIPMPKLSAASSSRP
jgi:hypothetical protein